MPELVIKAYKQMNATEGSPYMVCEQIQGYSEVPPGFPNSTARQPRQTRQKGAYK